MVLASQDLNFGDCMSYATADFLKAPLLFKGDDFEKTPIRAIIVH
jgi:ribonuclease VapC